MKTSDHDPDSAAAGSGSSSLGWGRPALALAVLALVAVAVLVTRERNAPEPTPPPSREEVAVGYLTAIAQGDAEKALSYSAQPQGGPLLTDAVLAESQATAPISDITVAGVTEDSVELSHRLGPEQVTTVVPMQTAADGQWQVQQAAAQVTIEPSPAQIPLQIDGQATLQTADETMLVFPGRHQLSTGAPWLDYTTTEFVVSNPAEPPHVSGEATPTDGATEAVRSALQDRLDQCAASGELAPEGCPWNLSEPPEQPFEPGSVTLSISGDPLADLPAPTMNKEDALAHGRISFTLEVSARTSGSNGDTQEYSDEVSVESGYTTDLLTEGPDFIWTD